MIWLRIRKQKKKGAIMPVLPDLLWPEKPVQRTPMIIRRVRVNRGLSPQEMLYATGCDRLTDSRVVEIMPHGEGDVVDVCFFKINCFYITDAELEREYDFLGLKSDPYAQCQANIDDPSFSEEHPNRCQWIKNGVRGFLGFRYGHDRRQVVVQATQGGTTNSWWFAGVRK